MAAIMEAYSPDCITLRGNGPIPEARHLPIGFQAWSRGADGNQPHSNLHFIRKNLYPRESITRFVPNASCLRNSPHLRRVIPDTPAYH